MTGAGIKPNDVQQTLFRAPMKSILLEVLDI